MKWTEKEKAKQNELQSSREILRESDGNKGKQLEGYRPGTKDKAQGNLPKQIKTVGNSFGNISVGTAGREEAVMLINQKKSMTLHELSGESKEIKEETARKVPMCSDNIKVNENKRTESALEYRFPKDIPVSYMLGRIEKISENHHFKVQKNMLPFINKRKTKKQLKTLIRLRQGKKEHKEEVQKQIDKQQNKIIQEEQLYEKVSNRLEEIRQTMKRNKNISNERDDFLYLMFLRKAMLLDEKKKQSKSGKESKKGEKI